MKADETTFTGNRVKLFRGKYEIKIIPKTLEKVE
jgi:hypothetical protein